MRLPKRIIALALVFALLLVAAPAYTLAVNDTSVQPGSTATLIFDFVNIYSINGSFSISDPQGMVAGYSASLLSGGAANASVAATNLYASQSSSEPVSTSVSVAVTVKVSATAALDTSCVVSFNGSCTGPGMEEGETRGVYQSAIVTVYQPEEEEDDGSADSPVQGEDPEPSPSPEPTPTPTPSPEPTPAPTPGTVPTPGTTSETVVKPIYYGELEKYISIAKGLNAADYTAEPMEALLACLADAEKALWSTEQDRVDAAAAALSAAIAELVKMDYSVLVQALAKADTFAASEPVLESWTAFIEAVERGNALLSSGEQEAVDACAAEILTIMAEMETKMGELRTSQLVEVEVPVEVLPEDDYCNVSSHRIWQVLFFISVALNVLAVVVIGAYISAKKKTNLDDTPLVDYDIDYDIDEEEFDN